MLPVSPRQPRRRSADRRLRLGPRDPPGRRTGSRASRSPPAWAGSTLPTTMQPQLDRRRGARPTRPRATGIKTRLPARHGRQQPVRRGACAASRRRATAHPQLFVLDTTDERDDHAASLARLEPARTLFLVASKSGGTVEVASMETLLLAHMSRALGERRRTPVHRHHRSGHRAGAARRSSAATARSS